MSVLDGQVYFVIWSYKDTGDPWNSLVHGYKNAVAEAESLIKNGNVNAVWVAVAVNVYKPEAE